jgi:hypothetical protein
MVNRLKLQLDNANIQTGRQNSLVIQVSSFRCSDDKTKGTKEALKETLWAEMIKKRKSTVKEVSYVSKYNSHSHHFCMFCTCIK